MLYRSKKDWWLVALVCSALSLPFVLGIYNLLAVGGNREAGWYLLFVGTLSGAVVLWLTYPLNYEVTDTTLIVRSGFMRKEIMLSAIEEVGPTRNPLSAPAWSLDRLYVKYRDGERKSVTLISPEEKAEFMLEVTVRGEGLELRGERVVRAV